MLKVQIPPVTVVTYFDVMTFTSVQNIDSNNCYIRVTAVNTFVQAHNIDLLALKYEVNQMQAHISIYITASQVYNLDFVK